MPLALGAKLGPYEVVAPLGAGGMGEVYRARDTTLERDVAIKVLPALLSQDSDRLRRFEQEARAAAALNHPNILAVFQMGTYEGALYLVSELLEGGTLRTHLLRGPMPVRKAIDYGVQIARGLAAAHEKGIVHRDLKPENLFVTKDGRVKILDFGLAKLTQQHSVCTQNAPTAAAGTESGVVLGTVGYMSPEQVRGKSADHCADIFAFGAILYEMLTGKRAFQKPTSAETMSAILNEEPPVMSQVTTNIAPALQRIVHRCLEKSAEQRFQSASDLAFALEALSDSSSSVPTVVGQLRPHRVWVWVAGFIAICAVVGATWWVNRSPRSISPPAVTLRRLTWDSGLTTDPALSNDGKLLAYASDRSGEGHLDIYVQQVGGGGEPLRLTQGPGDKREPAFSPDGTTIAFRSEQDPGGIYVVSTLGGPPRQLAPNGKRPRFSPDGNWIAYCVGFVQAAALNIRDQNQIYVVASAGGVARRVQPEFVAATYPVWSPDGTHLLFLGNRDNNLPLEASLDWWVTPLESGPAIKTGALEATRKAKLSGDQQAYPWALTPPAWPADGGWLVFSARSGDSTNLWRIGLDPKTWKVTGPPQRLTSGLTLEEKPSIALGPEGLSHVAFASASKSLSIWSLPVKLNEAKPTGKLQRLTQHANDESMPALSPEGDRMVFISSRPGNQEIWIKNLQTGQEAALTATRSIKFTPTFSPQGSEIAFGAYENGEWKMYLVPSTGGNAEPLVDGCALLASWTSDGKRALCNLIDGKIYLLDITSHHKTELLARRDRPDRWLCCGFFSPDDRWIAFNDSPSGTGLVPFKEGTIPESDWIDIMGPGSEPVGWSPDGNLVYLSSNRDGHECIWAQRLDPTSKRPIGPPFAVFHSHNARISLSNQNEFTVALRRDKMVFNMGERTGNIWMAEWKKQ